MARDAKKINTKKLALLTPDSIITDSNPLLREISYDVSFPLSKKNKLIMNQMIEFVRASQNKKQAKERGLRPAFGLSAIQIGEPIKIIYIRIEGNSSKDEAEELALINPEIISESKQKSYLKTGEGCLSVERDYDGYVLRSYEVVIRAIDYFTDREIEIKSKGLTAIVLQHEIDHLKGILFYDRINFLDPYKITSDAIRI